MSTYDWTKFSVRIPVNATKEKIYESFSTQQGFERWFLRKAQFTKSGNEVRDKNSAVQKDDQYEWMWHGYGDDTLEHGKILTANGEDTLQFTFAGNCTVTIKVITEDEKSIVELIQEDIPLDEDSKAKVHVGCMTGWTFYLANLKSILEGGIDLRNKDVKVKRVLNS